MDMLWLGLALLCYLGTVWLVRGCEKLQERP